MTLATMMAQSPFVPNEFRGQKEHVFLAMAVGADLGLSPFQSLQNIAIINGRTCIWGDTLLAVVKNYSDFEDIQERITHHVATCTVKRKHQSPHTVTFSEEDAKRAGLWGRNVWAKYPKRMLQMRARAFALRDVFPDALRGLQVREEVEDHADIPDQPIEIQSVESPSIDTTPALSPANETSRQLQQLIQQHAIDQTIIHRWLQKAGVKELSELNSEQTQHCIHWINQHYAHTTPSSDRAKELVHQLNASETIEKPTLNDEITF